MLDRAETLLHDHYAGKDYWDVSLYDSFLKNVGVIIIRLYLETRSLELKFNIKSAGNPYRGYLVCDLTSLQL